MKKIHFLTLQKKYIIIILVIVFFILGISLVPKIFYVNAPKTNYTIVIDAGHGGRDGGVVGANGTIEKEINLTYAYALKSLLESNDVKVIMTRSNDDGLYNESAPNKKRSDMAKRCEIIEKSNADLVVSIHMNAFPNRSAKGANCYYAQNNSAGKNIADNIQRLFHKNIAAPNTLSKVGDFYILNCTSRPSVLIECGFLSNAEEEILLNTTDYKDKIIYQIYSGIVVSLGIAKNNVAV